MMTIKSLRISSKSLMIDLKPFSYFCILLKNPVMKKVILIVILAATFLGCNNNESTQVNIRLANISEYDFKNVVVSTTGELVSYEDLNAGQTSQYQTFDLAYRYAFIELEIDGQTFTIQPIDYVGETPLSNGFYTYQLNANTSSEQYGRLILTLIED